MTLQSYLRPLPLIAVLRSITPVEIDAVGAALIDNGFRILEVPLNSPQPFDSISRLAHRFGERCLTGAGTVIEVADVARVAAAGGKLIVMPHADVGIVREAKKIGIPFAGHVPFSVSVVEASDAGQRSIEHEDDLSRACSSEDSLLRARSGDTTDLSGRRYSPRQYDGVLGSRRQRIWHRLEPVRPGGHGRCRA